MLEVGRVVNPRREHHDHRALAIARRQRGEGAVELGGVIVHGQNAVVLENLGQDALGDLAVFHHVGHPGRHAQIILQHAEMPVVVANQIRAADVRPHAEARRRAEAGGFEIVRFEHRLGGHDALGKNLLAVVHIVDKQVERAAALFETAAHPGPLPPGNNPRDQIEGPGAIDVAGLGVNGKRDAHFTDGQLGRRAAGGEFVFGQFAEQFDGGPGHLPRQARGGDQLVVVIAGAILFPA